MPWAKRFNIVYHNDRIIMVCQRLMGKDFYCSLFTTTEVSFDFAFELPKKKKMGEFGNMS